MPLACLTLLVPELLWPEPEDREALDPLACPALAALLARGRFSRRPPRALESVLVELSGQAAGVSCGALRRRGEAGVAGDDATARWIAADPVNLRFHQQRLLLSDAATLAIAPEEAAALVDALNGYFAGLGVFHAASAERWYLRLAADKENEGNEAVGALERLDAPPLSAIAGRGVERWLGELSGEREAFKLLNEIQTFLHAQPLNRRREKEGRPLVNSLWLWGGGTPPAASVAASFDAAWSDDPLAVGLARAAGAPAYPAPGGMANLLAQAASATRPLAVLEDLGEAVRREDGEAYRQSVAALEARWFAPAWRALARGVIGGLRLLAPTAYGVLRWDAGRAAPWRFWRRPQTLAATARALAASATSATSAASTTSAGDAA
ncbi:MAG: hypothetical protein LBS49_09405 [Candidatus Accumulibacter sp.]|jgi:hypothetical protein|nr:hypothetical protein [Accumulibacter sp.]